VYRGLRYMNVYGPHQGQTSAYTGVIPIMLNNLMQMKLLSLMEMDPRPMIL
jgi:nucleoside-diphosphate-sugar epimerase